MTRQIANHSPDQSRDRHHPIVGSEGLRLDGAACLSRRFADCECGLCATRCPTQAIALSKDGPTVLGECIGCGQCMAVCPTGALQADGFALPVDLTAARDELQVDCWRVAPKDSPPGTLRIPCLGGITKGWLLSLFARSGEKAIRLLDRGECQHCPAGTGIKALLATLTEARMLLHDCGVGVEMLPAMTSLPAKHAFSPSIPSAESEVRIDRRSFFRGLMGRFAEGAGAISTAGSPNEDPIVLRDVRVPMEQLRVAVALAQIAERHGRKAPPQAFPQLTLSDCCGHGVCARVCPTGALQRSEEAEHAELHFHSAMCIACGQCARNCPDRAIRVTPSGGTTGVEILARWRAGICDQCGNPYFGSGGTTCGSCEKSRQLHQGMAALFGRSLQQQ